MEHVHLHHHSHEPEHLLEEVLQQLKERYIRITPQRRAILDYLIRSHDHPSVEQIYQDLLPEHPSMSLATVYNNLKVLVEEGFVHEMKFSGVTSRYDFMGHRHYHVICDKCGKIADFTHTDLSFIYSPAQSQTGYHIRAAHLEAYGLCPSCQDITTQTNKND